MDNPFSLENKHILVTGASSGIGRQIAISAAGMGAGVHITARNNEGLENTLQQLKAGAHQKYIADLALEDQIDALAGLLPALDGVVLSAGIVKTLPFKFVGAADLSSIMQLNFYAPVLLINKLLKEKKLKKKCSIVFISSISGNFVGIKGNAMYSASKGAINSIQKVIALELAPQGIRVNNVSPGMVRTAMTAQATAFSAAQIAEDESRYPLGYGEATDVANAVIYLLSEASKWVTGTSLVLDGGYTLQ